MHTRQHNTKVKQEITLTHAHDGLGRQRDKTQRNMGTGKEKNTQTQTTDILNIQDREYRQPQGQNTETRQPQGYDWGEGDDKRNYQQPRN